MIQSEIDGLLFARMMMRASVHLRENKKKVDDLNVFPVPDGDTGTNMTLSLTSGVREMEKVPSANIGKTSQALSRGLLMGARGNSGVILSQLFRGFGKAVENKASINSVEFASALQSGVEMAYKAILKPVEGTILTVAKEAAKSAQANGKRVKDIVALMEIILEAAKEALARTPEQLPVLKQVGVVDSGGQGLVYVYEGFLFALRGVPMREEEDEQAISMEDDLSEIAHDQMPAQVGMRPEDIQFGYCTEFIVGLNGDYRGRFDETLFRTHLSQFGDSLLVISDDELVKVHIHAEHPGEVLSYAQQYGDFMKIKIENMREQLGTILERETNRLTDSPDSRQRDEVSPTITEENGEEEGMAPPLPGPGNEEIPDYALVSVSAGDGLQKIFRSIGITEIIPGGQTMNPSTEEIVKAIERIRAKHIFLLPNNGNIIMAAEQAKELVEVPVTVIPSKTIPQGIAAALRFDPGADAVTNEEMMNEAIGQVKTGQITYAIRDSQFGNMKIKEGDYLGIREKEILLSDSDLLAVAKGLIEKLVEEGDSILTIIVGEGVSENLTDTLLLFVKEKYPELEVEKQYGGQPVYLFLFSVE